MIVHDTEISAVAPSVIVKRFIRRLLVFVVSDKDAGAPRRFFTDRSSGHFIVITVHYAYFNTAHRSSGPAAMHVQSLGRSHVQVRHTFRRAVTLAYKDPVIIKGFIDQKFRNRRTAADIKSKVGKLFTADVQLRDKIVDERCRSHGIGHFFPVHHMNSVYTAESLLQDDFAASEHRRNDPVMISCRMV